MDGCCDCSRLTYKLCSEAQSGVADALLQYSNDVETEVLGPLSTIVNVRTSIYYYHSAASAIHTFKCFTRFCCEVFN